MTIVTLDARRARVVGYLGLRAVKTPFRAVRADRGERALGAVVACDRFHGAASGDIASRPGGTRERCYTSGSIGGGESGRNTVGADAKRRVVAW